MAENTFKVPSTWEMIKKTNKDKVDRIMNSGESELKEWHPELEPKYIEKPSVIDKGKALFQEAIESKRSEKEYEDVLREMLASPDEEMKMAAINAMKRSKANQVRDFITDVGVDAAAGALLGAAFGGPIEGAISGQKAGKNEIVNITEKSKEIIAKEGKDALKKTGLELGNRQDLLKKMIINSGKSTKQVEELMKQNKDIVSKFSKGEMSGEKAMKSILKSFEKEVEIGPDYLPDFYYILANDPNLSSKEAKKAINTYIKNHKNDTTLIDLLKFKEPKQIYKHIVRASKMTYKTAREFGMGIEEAKRLSEVMLLHDLGKITIPDRLLNSSVDLIPDSPLRNRMDKHVQDGYEMIKDIGNHFQDLAQDAAKRGDYKKYQELTREANKYYFAGLIAGSHHTKNKIEGLQLDELNNAITVIADVWDALTSGDRTYKDIKDFNTAKKFTGSETENFNPDLKILDKIDSLKKRRQIPRWDKNDDDFIKAYQAIRANALKENILNTYRNEYLNKNALKPSKTGAGIGAGLGTVVGIGNEIAKDWKRNASGGIEPTFPAYTSDALNEAWPWWRDKKDKADEIVKWIKDGLLSEEQMELFKNTDFNNNKEVTALWERLNKELF